MNTLSMAISPSGSQPVEAELTKNGMLRIHYRSTTRRLAAVSPWM